MCCYLRRIFAIVVIICLIQIHFTAEATFISPQHENFNCNTCELLIQTQPSAINIPESYCMCKVEDFSSTFPNLKHPVVNAGDIPKYNAENHYKFYQLQTWHRKADSPQKSTMNAESYMPPTNAQYPTHVTHFPHYQYYYPSSPSPKDFRPPNLPPSKIELFPLSGSNNYYGSKMNSFETNNRNANNQQLKTEPDAHIINSEQFNALLQCEVLGAPHLSCAHHDVLPIQKMYTSPQYIDTPPKYLGDPILRKFYDQQYAPSEIRQEQFKSVAQAKLRSPFAPTEPLNKDKSSNINIKHVFIPVPHVVTSPNCNLMPNLQYKSIDQRGSSEVARESNSGKDYDNAYHSQMRTNSDYSSMEKFPNNDKLPQEINNKSSIAQTGSSLNSTSTEEYFFVEDPGINIAAVNDKNDEEHKDDETAVVGITTSAPQTTVKNFKTMIHNAKMLAMGLRGDTNSPQPKHNYRNTPNATNGISDNSNLKRQYVKQLEKNNN